MLFRSEFGRWMLGYAEDPPFTITDNSNEAWFRWLKKNLRSMTGGTGANTSAMMSRLFERINMQSRQQVHDLREEGNSAQLPSLPKLDKPLWMDIQTILQPPAVDAADFKECLSPEGKIQ